MDLRANWNCPDLPREKWLRSSLPIVGSAPDSEEFEDCPAYYLREGWMGLPAEHLMPDGTHLASLVGEWAMEIESGARSIDSLSPKARTAVHLYLRERNARDRYLMEMPREKPNG